jgi:hypothetical protein
LFSDSIWFVVAPVSGWTKFSKNGSLFHECTHLEELYPILLYDANPSVIIFMPGRTNFWMIGKRVSAVLSNRDEKAFFYSAFYSFKIQLSSTMWPKKKNK